MSERGLSPRERFAIAGAIAALLIPARAAVTVVAYLAGVRVFLLLSVTGAVTIVLVAATLPLVMGVVERTTARPLWLRVPVHIGLVAVLFVVINTILFLLLRRAPKGIDV